MTAPLDEPVNEDPTLPPDAPAPPTPTGIDLSALLPGAYSGQSAAYDQSGNILTRGMSAMGEAGMSQMMMTKFGDVTDVASALGPMIAKKNISWVDLMMNNPDILAAALVVPFGFGAAKWRVNAKGNLTPSRGNPSPNFIEVDAGNFAAVREGSYAMYNSTANPSLQTPDAIVQMASQLLVGVGPGAQAGQRWLDTPVDHPGTADLEGRTIDEAQPTYNQGSIPGQHSAYELRFRQYPAMRTATSANEIGNAMAAPGGLAAIANSALHNPTEASAVRGAFIQQYVDFIASGETAHMHPHLNTETLQQDLASNPQLAFDMAKEDIIRIQALWEADFVSGELGAEFVQLQRDFLNGNMDIQSEQGKRLLNQWKALGTVAKAFPNADIEFRDNPHMRPTQVGLTEDGAYLLFAVTNRGVMIDRNGEGDVYTTQLASPKAVGDSQMRVPSLKMTQTAEVGKPVRYKITDSIRSRWKKGLHYLGVANDLSSDFDFQPYEAMETQNILNLIGFTISDADTFNGQRNPMATSPGQKADFVKTLLGDDADVSDPNIVQRIWTETMGTETNRMGARGLAISRNSYGLYSVVLHWVKQKSGMRWTEDTYQTVFGMLSLRAELYGANLPGFIEWALGWQDPEITIRQQKTASGGTRPVEVAKLKMSKAGKELGEMFTNLPNATDVDVSALIRQLDEWYDRSNNNWEGELDAEGNQKHYTLLDDNVARTKYAIADLNDGEYTQVASYDDYVGIDPATGELTGPLPLAAMMYEMVVMAKGTKAERAAVKDSIIRKSWNKGNLVKNLEPGIYRATLPDQTLLEYDAANDTFSIGNALTGEKIRTFGPASDQIGRVADGSIVTYADLMQVVDVLYRAPSDIQSLTVNDTHQVGVLLGVGIPGNTKSSQFDKMESYQVMSRAVLNAMRMYPDLFRNAHSAQALLWTPWRELTGTSYRTVVQPKAMREMTARSDDPMLLHDTFNSVDEDAMLPIDGLDIPEKHFAETTGLVYRDSNGNQMYLVREGFEEMHPGWVVLSEYSIPVRTYKPRTVTTAQSAAAKKKGTNRPLSTHSEPVFDDSGEPVLTPKGRQKTKQVPNVPTTFHPAVPRTARIVADSTAELAALKANAQTSAGEPSRVVNATLHQHTLHSTILRAGGWTRLMHMTPSLDSVQKLKDIVEMAKAQGINVDLLTNEAFQSQGYSTPYLVPDWGEVSRLSGVELPNERGIYDPTRDSGLGPGDAEATQGAEAPAPVSRRSYGTSRYGIDPALRGAEFHDAIVKTTEDHPVGKAVEVKDPEFYTDPSNHLFLSEDGLAGVAVTSYGDLVSVFKHPDSNASIGDLLADASTKSITGDAFDINGFLPNLYARYGYKPVARMKFNREFAPDGWNYEKLGTPDIVYLVRDPFDVTDLPKTDDYNTVRDEVPVLDWEGADARQAEYRAKVIAGREAVGDIDPNHFVDNLDKRLSELTPEELAAVTRVIPEASTSQSTNTAYGKLSRHGIDFEVEDSLRQQADSYLDFGDSESADKFIALLYSDLQATAPTMYTPDYKPANWRAGETRPTQEGSGVRVIDLLGDQTQSWKMYVRDANDLPEHVEAFMYGEGVDGTYQLSQSYEYVATDGVQDVSYLYGDGDLSDPNAFPVLTMTAPNNSLFSEAGDSISGVSNSHASASQRPMDVQFVNGRVTWGNDLTLHAATESDVSRLYEGEDIEYVIPDSGSFLDVEMRSRKLEPDAEWEDLPPPSRLAIYIPKADQVPIVMGRPLHTLRQAADGYAARQSLTDVASNDIPEVAFDHENLNDYMVKQRGKDPLRSIEVEIVREKNKMPMYIVKVNGAFPLAGIQVERLLIRAGARPSRIRLEGEPIDS